MVDAAAAAPDDSLPSSDKGSIQFLLNGGTDSFNERFLLPPRSDRARCLEYYNRLEKAEESPTRDLVEDEVQGYPPAFSDSDPSTLLSFQDPFFWLFNGPFDALQTLSSEPFSSDMLDPTLIPAPDGASSALSGDLIYGHEQPFATAMIQAIRAQAWAVVALDSNAQAGISIDLEYLLTTTRILKFISMYFRYWQPSCAILHRPSLDPGAISLRLLVSITFLGAMYSQDERESPVAKRLVDFAELYVFSSDVYAPEHDIGLAFAGIQKTKYTMDDCQFQDFQAGYLMCVVQYWSGSPTSRSRAMESRFSEVIKIARRTDLLRCRHQLNESADEQMWIQKECRIR